MRKVFLSSTGADLGPWRQAVHDLLVKSDKIDVAWMRDWVSHAQSSLDVCRDKVNGSEIFVGLIGHCFGSAPEEHPLRSYTMLEWDWAAERGLPRLMRVAPGDFPVLPVLYDAQTPEQKAAQRAFRDDDLKGWHTGQSDAWANADRLAGQVALAVWKAVAELDAQDQPGFSRPALEAQLYERLLELTRALATAGDERTLLAAEKAAVEEKLGNLDRAYAQAHDVIAGLEADIARYGNRLDPAHRDEAARVMAEGDFDAAEALYARITDFGEMEAERTAAYFQRGKIAEEQVRWADAARHYGRAATLAPDYDRLFSARLYAYRAGDHSAALTHGTLLMTTARQDYAEDAPRIADALISHAQTLSEIGRYQEAEPLYRQAIDIRKACINGGVPDDSVSLSNLANLLRDTGRYDEAEPLYRQAIEIDKATLGEGHPDHAIHLNNLALLLLDTGRYDEAELLFRQAIEIGEATLDERHPDYATRLNNLAGLLRAVHRHDEAEPLYRQMMPMLRGKLGDEHPNTKQGATNYARLLRAHFPDDPALAELEAVFGEDIEQ